jgi:hypothetical protein
MSEVVGGRGDSELGSRQRSPGVRAQSRDGPQLAGQLYREVLELALKDAIESSLPRPDNRRVQSFRTTRDRNDPAVSSLPRVRREEISYNMTAAYTPQRIAATKKGYSIDIPHEEYLKSGPHTAPTKPSSGTERIDLGSDCRDVSHRIYSLRSESGNAAERWLDPEGSVPSFSNQNDQRQVGEEEEGIGLSRRKSSSAARHFKETYAQVRTHFSTHLTIRLTGSNLRIKHHRNPACTD